MNRSIAVLAALLVALPGATPGALAEGPPKLSALLFYATDGDGSDAPEQVPDPGGDRARHAAALRKAFAAKQYLLIGRHSAPVSTKYSIWLKPSPQFPLQIENTGTTPDGGLSIYWILWQKEAPPTKDRELVKSNAVLTRQTPMVIAGPRWRSGRLVFVIRSE
jgi:hypothetical protein